MPLHLHAVTQGGLLEQLESADPRTISTKTLRCFAQRVSHLMGHVAHASTSDERHALEEFEYGAECVVEHYTPAPVSALERYRQNQEIRNTMEYEEDM